jgi:peroxiredoxin
MTDLTQLPPDLPVPEDDGAADHLPGTAMPHLGLPTTAGRSLLLDQLGDGRVVIYVYPLTGRPDVDLPDGWDNIPGARGCTAEACDFRDHHSDLLAAGASAVYGLSSQSQEYQRELVERLHLPFEMISDTELVLARQLSFPTFRAGGVDLYRRMTLVVRAGRVEHAFYPVFPPNTHAQQVITWLEGRPA